MHILGSMILVSGYFGFKLFVRDCRIIIFFATIVLFITIFSFGPTFTSRGNKEIPLQPKEITRVHENLKICLLRIPKC